MYVLHDLAKTAQDEKLRAAARGELRTRAAAARHAANRDGSAGRRTDLRILRVLRVRRAAQAC